jgi:hypothetical protein
MDDCHLGYIRNFLKKEHYTHFGTQLKGNPILRFTLEIGIIKLRTRV